MTEASPPPIAPQLPEVRNFVRRDAMFTLLAPLIAAIIAVLEFVCARGHGPVLTMVFGFITFLQLVLILSGLSVGIVTLIIARPYERKAVLGKTLAGICISALFVLMLFLPFILRAVA